MMASPTDDGLRKRVGTKDVTKEEGNDEKRDVTVEAVSRPIGPSGDFTEATGFEYEDDEYSSGEESDIEDNDEPIMPMKHRDPNPDLPDTAVLLETPEGCKVYVVGTAHFSTQSQEDVSRVVQATQPDVVMLELCKSRMNVLELDETTLLEEAKNINMEKIRLTIKQSGVVQGVMNLLLLSMSAHLTKELGMAPGGEFRRAFREAQLVPGCRLHLGDRPIHITLKRALGSLSVWQKLMLAWYILTSKEPISKEEVEKCKQKDILEQMLKDMTGEFPALTRVFLDERDAFLTHSLKYAARPIHSSSSINGFVPSVVVGVVGIGHVPGIVANWSKEQNIQDIITIPQPSTLSRIIKITVKISFFGLVTWGCYRIIKAVI
ncbi:hypothetical protein SNE40_015068 [Patella caerulea]|uniref:TraB domain-containing protein n=2 Tax=Patella caerulea TaxID=87958 RepID=A0AAN8JMG3_PATCE